MSKFKHGENIYVVMRWMSGQDTVVCGATRTIDGADMLMAKFEQEWRDKFGQLDRKDGGFYISISTFYDQ